MTKEQEVYVQGMKDMLTAIQVAFELGGLDREDLDSLELMIERYKAEHSEE